MRLTRNYPYVGFGDAAGNGKWLVVDLMRTGNSSFHPA